MGLKGDYDNHVGNAGQRLLLYAAVQWMGAIGDYVDAHGLVTMGRTTK